MKKTTSLLLSSALLLTGCQMAERLAETGNTPPLTRVQNPADVPGYTPVTMPMPAPTGAPFTAQERSNSLWQSGSKAFFKDQRAKNIGDILTILIDISDDTATLENKTERKRDSKENMTLTEFFNVPQKLAGAYMDRTNTLAALENNPSTKGEGKVDRKEKVKTKVVATVMQILPNGNLVVKGRQEIRLNYEVRELDIAGVVRPQDISSENTIPLEKIAEARFSYGGRGQIDDMQHPGWGQEILDVIAPY